MGRSENIRFNVYLNDRQAGNTMGQLYKESRVLRSELNKLKIGSAEWISKLKEVQKVQGKMKMVRDEIKNTNGWLSRMAGNFNKYFGIVTAGIAGITAAVYGIRQSMNVLVDFEKSLANVLTLLSESDKKKYGDFLKQGSLEIMKKYGFAVQDTNKAMFDAISAGVKVGNSIKFMNEASQLAIGGVTSLSTSVDGLTTIINAFKLEESDAAKVSAAFFSAQKEGKTTVELLAQNVGKAAPMAHQLGISYQALLSAGAALTKGGIDTQTAFTYLRATFNTMIKPTTELASLFKNEFGFELNATAVKSKGFTAILRDLNILLQKYPNHLQAAVANVRALTGVTALSGKGLEEYERILKNVQTDIGANNSLIQAFTMQNKTMSQELNRAKANLTTMTINLMQGFRPAITQVARGVSAVSHSVLRFAIFLKDNASAVKNFAKALGIVITSLATYKAVVAAANAKVNIAIKLTGIMQGVALRMAIVYNKLTGNISRAAAAQRVLNTTTEASPWGLVISILATVAAAYFAFKDNVKKAADETKRMNDEIQRGQDIMTNSKSIKDRFAVVNKLSADQLQKLKDDIKAEQAMISEKEAHILTVYTAANNKQVKGIIDLTRRIAKEKDAGQKAMMENQLYWAKKELDQTIKKEQGISATEIDTRKATDAKMLAEVDTLLAKISKNKKTAGEDDALEYLKQAEELNAKIKALAHAQELAKMGENTREIQLIKDKYAKLIGEAKGHSGQIKQLQALEAEEINQKREEQDKSYLKKKKEVERKVSELGYDSEEKELAANQQMYEQLIDLANKYGLDTTDIMEKYQEAQYAIKKKYADKEAKAKKKAAKDSERLQEESRRNTYRVLIQTAEDIKGVLGEQTAAYKALAIFQTTISTYASAEDAYKSALKVPVIGPTLAPIAAAAAVAFGLAQIAKIVSTKEPSYGKGGIAQGASHNEGGIAMIDSKTGNKVGEMEGGEPYLILSKETYKNNHDLVNALLNSSMHRNGERVPWMKPGYYPHPDLSGVTDNLRQSKYAAGTVTNVSNIVTTTAQGDIDIASLHSVMTDLLGEFKNFPTKLKVIMDLDGTLELKKNLEKLQTIEDKSGM